MSHRNRWNRLTLPAFAGSLFLAQGCGHMGVPAPQTSAKPPAQEHGPALGSRESADIQLAAARSFEKRGQTDKAIASYTTAAKQDPKQADAYLRLAILHDKQGKFDQSAVFYRKALKARPGDPNIYADMGYSLYLQRRWAEAEMNLRQAIALKADHARAHNNLGLLLARTNRREEALAEFQKGGCAPADAHNNLAFALASDGQLEEGQAQYQIALAANQSSPVARKGLRGVDRLLSRTREWREPEPAQPSMMHSPAQAPSSDTAISTAEPNLPQLPAPLPPQAIEENISSLPGEAAHQQTQHSIAASESGAPTTPAPATLPAQVADESAPRRLPFAQSDPAPLEENNELPAAAEAESHELLFPTPDSAPPELRENVKSKGGWRSAVWWLLGSLAGVACAFFLGIRRWRNRKYRQWSPVFEPVTAIRTRSVSEEEPEVRAAAVVTARAESENKIVAATSVRRPMETTAAPESACSNEALKALLADFDSPRYGGRHRSRKPAAHERAAQAKA